MINLQNLTIEKAHDAFLKGDFTVRELVDEYLKNIKEKNSDINAYIEIFNDIDSQVARAEEMFKNGSATLMTGIPISIKDNMLVEGKIASAGSKILGDYVATYTSFAIKKLIDQGVVILGRTNMDEFAMGSSTQTSAYGITKNPLDTTRVPGGSSGGAAASVSMDGALIAIGSETCGSVRQPAAFNGLVGFKPTYGSVSRSGLIAMGNSLDQICPLAKNVGDAKIVHDALSGIDPLDATTVPLSKRVAKERSKKMKIAVPSDVLEGKGIDKEVHDAFLKTFDVWKKMGYEIVPYEFKFISYALPVYYVVMPAEVSTNLERFDGIRYGYRSEADNLFDFYSKSRGLGFGKEARRRILLGTYVLSNNGVHYRRAIQVRAEITKEIDALFEQVDFYITPTAPTLPFKIGENMNDPLAMYYSDVFSAPANLSGCPAIAVPTGLTPEGLPTSIQITAPRWADDELFSLAQIFEKEL